MTTVLLSTGVGVVGYAGYLYHNWQGLAAFETACSQAFELGTRPGVSVDSKLLVPRKKVLVEIEVILTPSENPAEYHLISKRLALGSSPHHRVAHLWRS